MAKTFNSVLTATFMALQLTSADEATSRLQDSIWKKIWDYLPDNLKINEIIKQLML